MEQLLSNKIKNKIWLGNNFENDVFNLLGSYFNNAHNVLVITGSKSFADSRESTALKRIFSKQGIVSIIHRINTNPKYEEIMLCLPDKPVDLIIAIGGGSVIDCAKIIKHYTNSRAEIFAIYTILGSGSIVSAFAIYDSVDFKIGEMHANTVPSVSYINEDLIQRVPLDLQWIGIADIASHALESLLSLSSSPESRTYAISALNKIKSYMNRLNKDDLLTLIEADLEAGISEQTGIVLLPHAVGHYLTYKFKVPHGKANLVIMERYLKFLISNGVYIKQEYMDLLEEIFHKNEVSLLPEYLTSNNFEEMINLIHKNMPFVFENSPVPLQINDLKKIILPNHAS